MHAHDGNAGEWLPYWTNAATLILVGAVVLFALSLLPIPIGYDRRKVKWLMWCGTGMHAHTVYWWGEGHGFQAMHPADLGESNAE